MPNLRIPVLTLNQTSDHREDIDIAGQNTAVHIMNHSTEQDSVTGGPGDVRISSYHYDLPADRIAEVPPEERGASRLLRYRVEEDRISHHVFAELPDLIPENATILWNNTRVVPARLRFRRETGGRVELFLLNPILPSVDPAEALSSHGETTWLCLAGGMKRLKPGELLAPEDQQGADAAGLTAEILEKGASGVPVRFRWSGPDSFSEVIERYGHTPLPPYIDREERESDRTDYQTVYAAAPGAVAAPTAGLHFTDRLIGRLREKGISFGEVTLHVGAGTFAPVKSERVADHAMHVERFGVSLGTLEMLAEALAPDRTAPVVHVGTTTLRTVESLYWIGESILSEGGELSDQPVRLDQWRAIQRSGSEADLPAASKVFGHLVEQMKRKGIQGFVGETALMILPGYRFMTCDRLITNFHQPGSTLILLVAAFLGEDRWRTLYQTALEEGYRFLSFGDASLLERR